MLHELEVLLDNIFSNGAEEDGESYKNNKTEVLKMFKKLEEYEMKIKVYEDYFEENRVEVIEEKLEPYYEELQRIYSEE